MMRKQNQIAHLLAHPIMIPLTRKEPAQAILADVVFDSARIKTGASYRQSTGVEIRSKELNGRPQIAPTGFFEQDHRNGVGLFASCATAHPDPDGIFVNDSAVEEMWK